MVSFSVVLFIFCCISSFVIIFAGLPNPGDVSVSWLSVPRKRIALNPFPSPIDLYDPLYNDPLPLLLQTAQKYFIPARSYIHDS
jgi:hypothetical protein